MAVPTFSDSNGLHADDHSLFFDGAGNIYTGNDGGVWKRSATAAVGTAWTNLNNAPLNTMQFEGIAVHPTDRNLMIGGTQDNGTEYQQTSGGNWRGAEGGDGGYALIDQSATNTTNVTMYHTFFNQRNGQIGFDRVVDYELPAHQEFLTDAGRRVRRYERSDPRAMGQRTIFRTASISATLFCSMRRWLWGRARQTPCISELIGCTDPRIEATT